MSYLKGNQSRLTGKICLNQVKRFFSVGQSKMIHQTIALKIIYIYIYIYIRPEENQIGFDKNWEGENDIGKWK